MKEDPSGGQDFSVGGFVGVLSDYVKTSYSRNVQGMTDTALQSSIKFDEMLADKLEKRDPTKLGTETLAERINAYKQTLAIINNLAEKELIHLLKVLIHP